MVKLAAAVNRRIATFLFIIIVTLVGLAARIAWIQFVDGPKLTQRVQSQITENWTLQSSRATIYDRQGRELAISLPVKSLYANPKQLNKDAAAVAQLLAPLLQMPAEDIRERLVQDCSFIWLKRMLDADKSTAIATLIKEQGLTGLAFLEENKRYYPNESLAAHVLGFVGVDDVGLDGIEFVLDDIIKGDLVKRKVATDNRGVPIFNSVFNLTAPKQGKSVALTIDSTIQFIVEQSLDQAMAKTKAQSATVIVMNPRTGEILAMASRPTYDPNRFYQYSPAEWKNRAVSVIYEPGSTFKTIVAAAALEEKLVRPEDRFEDAGYVEVSGRRIKNWNDESFGNISFTEIIKYSVNTGFVEIGMRLGAEKLNAYTRAFGFGQHTGIELPGEEQGILFNPRNMRESDLATMSIGHSIAVTPLQLLTAVAAIANDGVLVKPHIIKEVYNPDGSLDYAVPTQPVRQVVSPATAKALTMMMEKVVSEGGGKLAAVPGYRFAGKTGTAEKLQADGSGYAAGHYIASFVGFGPVEDPQLAALVVIDDPQGVYYGGTTAAPVFSEIMTQVLRYLNVEPANNVLPVPVAVNDVNAQADPLPVKPVDSTDKVIVPNVVGKTIREAGELLTQAGLAFIPKGSGIAVKQSIPPNTLVTKGTEIVVDFARR